jgi:hypothetical protein
MVWNHTLGGVLTSTGDRMPVTTAVYHIVFHEGCWRIEYAGLHFGEYETAERAADAALHVAQSRICANGVRIFTDHDGHMTVRDRE